MPSPPETSYGMPGPSLCSVPIAKEGYTSEDHPRPRSAIAESLSPNLKPFWEEFVRQITPSVVDSDSDDSELGDDDDGAAQVPRAYGVSAADMRRSSTSTAINSLELVGVRGALGRMLKHHNFDLLMGFVITCNICIMVIETDANAPCANSADKSHCKSDALVALNYVFLAIYTIEASIRIVVLHCKVFFSVWNILDLVVVFSGFVDLAASKLNPDAETGPSVSLLRIFRVFRLLRAVRIMHKIPELYAMLRGFLGAMQSMFWGFVMILILLMISALLCVELVHPLSLKIHADNEECQEAFQSVWTCTLMLFQTLVAGDSWGNCSLPIIKEHWWTFIIFAGTLVCIQLGFMNLITAVIVERAAQAKEEDEKASAEHKLRVERKAAVRLRKLFAEIDVDQNGLISRDELFDGFDFNHDMQSLFAKLDISRKDAGVIFDLMVSPGADEVSCDDLFESLHMTQLDANRKSLAIVRLQAAEIVRTVKKINSFQAPQADPKQSIPSNAKVSSTQLESDARVSSPSAKASRQAKRPQSIPSDVEASLTSLEFDDPGSPCSGASRTANRRQSKYWSNAEASSTQLESDVRVSSSPGDSRQAKLLRDMDVLYGEVTAFRSYLEEAVAGIRSGIAKLDDTAQLSLVGQGVSRASTACDCICAMQPMEGSMQPPTEPSVGRPSEVEEPMAPSTDSTTHSEPRASPRNVLDLMHQPRPPPLKPRPPPVQTQL